MIDIKFLRENPDVVKENIKKKFQDHKLKLVDEVLELDVKNREAKLNGDNLRSERKTLSTQIGNLMRNGKKDEGVWRPHRWHWYARTLQYLWPYRTGN